MWDFPYRLNGLAAAQKGNLGTKVLAAAAAVATAPIAWAGADFSAAASVVQIHSSPASGGKVDLGSGVVIDGQRVVTNCHVTRHARSVVVSKGALRFEAVTEQSDVKRDICLLEVPTLSVKPTQLGSSRTLRKGQPVMAFGFPRGVGMSASMGQVVALHRYGGDFVIETSTAITGGSSGGGLFNQAGQLVGIASFFSAGSDRHYYALPTEWISTVNKAPKREVGPLQGMAFWQDPLRLPLFLRVMPRK